MIQYKSCKVEFFYWKLVHLVLGFEWYLNKNKIMKHQLLQILLTAQKTQGPTLGWNNGPSHLTFSPELLPDNKS